MLVETEDDVDNPELPDPDKIAYIHRPRFRSTRPGRSSRGLRERFPQITGPRTDDICYATTNRQAAVKAMAGAR